MQKDSSRSIEEPAQPWENEHSNAYPRRRRGGIIPGTFKDGQADGHDDLAAPMTSLALPLFVE